MTHNGLDDVFLFSMSPNGNGLDDLQYSTFIGGEGYDEGLRLLQDSAGDLIVAGVAGINFPITEGAYDTSFADPEDFPNVGDGFVIRFANPVTGVDDEIATDPTRATWLSAVYPNPTEGFLRYSIELDEATAVDVGVFDIRGRRVQTLMQGYMPAGVHNLSTELEISKRNLAQGIYYLRLETNSQQLVRKFSVVR